jgi:hypothetical protein
MYDKELGKKLEEKCYDLVKKSTFGKSESVCIYVWKPEEVTDGENELWVVVRDKRLVTCWRRNETERKCTSSLGMNVDRMSYQLVN